MEEFSTSCLWKNPQAINHEDRRSIERVGVCVDCRGKFSADDCTVCWDCLYARYQQLGQCA